MQLAKFEEMGELNRLLDGIAEDRTVPRNIRIMIQETRASLNNSKEDPAIRINSAISVLDEVSNDPNIPVYTRTQIWNIVSVLEVLNERLKV